MSTLKGEGGKGILTRYFSTVIHYDAYRTKLLRQIKIPFSLSPFKDPLVLLPYSTTIIRLVGVSDACPTKQTQPCMVPMSHILGHSRPR